jgi:hypothetical protein
MAINDYTKYLSTATPNLALQSNITQFLLWGTAGVLSGLDITSVVLGTGPTDGKVIITLTPGAFIQGGIVVEYPDGIVVPPLTRPAAQSLSDPMYLIVKSNGANTGSQPNWSFMPESTYRAQLDYKNFAAIVGVYQLQVTPNSISQQVGFTGDVSVAWTPVPALPVHVPPFGHFSVLNSSDAALSGFVLEGGFPAVVDVIDIENLGSNAKSVLQAVLTARVIVNNVLGITLKSTNGTITITGTTGAAVERFSAFANGIEVFYDAPPGSGFAAVATGLENAINLVTSPWITIAKSFPLTAGGIITLTSVQFGQAGNFDLQVTKTTSAGSTAVISRALPTNGAQGSIKVEFVGSTGAPSVVPSIIIYPPAPLVPGAGTPTVMSFPVDITSIDAVTFNSLKFRITSQCGAGEKVSIGQTSLALTISENFSAIDQIPPTQLSHWTSGPVVSVGGGEGTSLQGHRLSDPIDHLDRSIPGVKLKLRAVGPLEISQYVVGTSFLEGLHSYPGLDQPWTLSPPSDLNLEECSDLIKGINKTLGQVTVTGTGGTINPSYVDFVPQLFKSHIVNTGLHRSATYVNVTAPPPGALLGLQAQALGGDTTIDIAPFDGGTSMVTQGQFAVRSDDVNKSALFSSRTASNVPVAETLSTPVVTRDLVISSPAQAIAGKIGLAVGMDVTNPHITAAYDIADIKPLSGISKLDNIPVHGLINNEVTLFEGWVVFVRIDGLFTLRTINPADRFFSDAAFSGSTSSDGIGAMTWNGTNSFLPDAPRFGAAYYADFGSPNDFLNGLKATVAPTDSVVGIDTSLAQLSTGLGYFPAPVKAIPAVALDANAGSEWLYLPFPKKDIFGSISVSANIFSVSGPTVAGTGLGASLPSFFQGIMVAPAYDAREIVVSDPAWTLTAPVYAPVPNTGAFKSKSTGLVRRHPWVLTPYGMGRRITFAAPGAVPEDSYYYNPSNAPTDTTTNYSPYEFFTRPLTDYATSLSRSTLFRTSNIGTSDSYVIRGALPYYDRRRSTETTLSSPLVAGIVINAAQINSFSGIDRAPDTSRAYRMAPCAGTVSLMDRYTAPVPPEDLTKQVFTKVGGAGLPAATRRTPDGIAVCVHRWDYGIAGKSAVGSGMNAVPPGGVVPYNQTSASPNFVEAPIAIHLKITGTLVARLKLAMSL